MIQQSSFPPLLPDENSFPLPSHCMPQSSDEIDSVYKHNTIAEINNNNTCCQRKNKGNANGLSHDQGSRSKDGGMSEKEQHIETLTDN